MILALSLLLAAANQPDVTLASDCETGLVTAIREELEVAGFPTELSSEGGQVAHLDLHCIDASVVVEVEDRVTPKSVKRTLQLQSRPRAEVLVALQVVELLHASLAETRFAALTRVPEPVVRFLDKREPAAPSAWNLAAGVGVTWAPMGFGVQPSVSVEVSRSVSTWNSARLELGLLLTGTVHASQLQGIGGTAEIGLVESRGVFAVNFPRAGWMIRPRFSAGLLLVWAAGLANSGYGARSGATATFETGLGLTVSREVTNWLSLFAGVDVAITPFPVVVRVPDSSTQIGVPLLAVQMGAVFR